MQIGKEDKNEIRIQSFRSTRPSRGRRAHRRRHGLRAVARRRQILGQPRLQGIRRGRLRPRRPRPQLRRHPQRRRCSRPRSECDDMGQPRHRRLRLRYGAEGFADSLLLVGERLFLRGKDLVRRDKQSLASERLRNGGARQCRVLEADQHRLRPVCEHRVSAHG